MTIEAWAALDAAFTRQGWTPSRALSAADADRLAGVAAELRPILIGVGQGVRLRACEAGGCELVFFDVTRNASRRFCGLSCQNRAKASACRARRRA
ncbi:CGNR zinc finger domain-containing protein [Nonomuraea sp. M3C6]|uniref:CGNR zinc finger domain-containing protein n=1 Tax=Nonomuraea marmarensis TaxID=3351344 RepID=A0ABW7AK01_9ACTN